MNNENDFVEDRRGTKRWRKNGKLHREGDKPAVVYASGSKGWYKNGKRHREGDKPADVYTNGSKLWYQNGEIHREGDKPAIVRADGAKCWYKNGELHREGDKPALVYDDGRKFWYKNGELIGEFWPITLLPDGKIRAGCFIGTVEELRALLAEKGWPTFIIAIYENALTALEVEGEQDQITQERARS